MGWRFMYRMRVRLHHLAWTSTPRRQPTTTATRNNNTNNNEGRNTYLEGTCSEITCIELVTR